MPREPETFRTLYCDPGEDFGWCIGKDMKLLSRGTTKMWLMADDVWDILENPDNPENALNDPSFLRAGVDPSENTGPIGRIVCEDWRLYPDKLKDLAWDRCRTARVIGALTMACRRFGIPFVLQPAAIKPAAVAAGAEELFDRPLRENRHQNDAMMHFTWYTNVEMLGVRLQTLNNVRDESSDSATRD
jgi:hypothetical protein